MENPATWTPLHHDIHHAYYTSPDGIGAVLNVLQHAGYRVTAEQVQAVVNQHNQDMEDHICGHSLPAMMVNALAKEENKW
jgi:hypothetical protein